MRRIFRLLVASGLVVWACSDQGPPLLSPEAVTQLFGPAGGTLVSKDGNLRLEIPAGALSANRTLIIDEVPASELGSAFNGTNVSKAYVLGPSGATFAVPVTISIKSDQRATVTDSMISVRTQSLFTSENGTRVGMDSTRITVTGDTVWVSGQVRHFSPAVLEEANNTIIDFAITGVPASAEVKRPFNVLAKASLRDPNMGIVSQLRGGVFLDNSELIDNLVSFANAEAVNNVIEVPMPYECPSVGLGTHRGSFHMVYENSNFAATDPGKRVNVVFTTRSRDLDCVQRTAQLTIEFRGNGGGKVDGGPFPEFTCTATCQKRLLEGALATLTATPNELSTFAGFSGQCGSSGVPAVMEPLAMDGDRLCIVTFMLKVMHNVTITKTGQGSGTVTGGVQGSGTPNQLDCGEKCVVPVPEGAKVELRSTPSIGSRHGSWGPGCLTTTPNAPVIEITVNQPVNCAVFFPLEKLNIAVSPSSPTIVVGDAQHLDVTITDETGPVTGREVTFLSGNPSVATVDAQGNVSAVSPGLATIVVTVGGPGGGTVNVVVNVVQRMFALTVTKTGSGRGTTTVVNTSNGVSSDSCDPSCPGTTTQAVAGSVLHVLANPEAGSTFVRFLEDCALQSPGSGPATGVVEMTGAKSCTVEFGVDAPLSIAFGGLTSKSSGLSVSLGNVSGVVYADYQTENLPQSDSLNVFVTLNGKPAGTCFPPSLGGAIRCEIDTAATVDMDSIAPGLRRGAFVNGTQSLALIAKLFGETLGTHSEDVTLNNRNTISITTNNPAGATSLTWRAGSIEVRAKVGLYDDIPLNDLRLDFTSSPVTGFGTMTWASGPANDPFVFTANPSNSATAQGAFQGAIRVFDGGGNDITGQFDLPAPWQQNVDMVPPFVPSLSIPSTTFISGGVLILDNPTGPYAAGTRIRLNRITGGSLGGIDACDAAHYHGTISIRRENSSVSDGPFADPNGPACGHGKVVTEDFLNVLWSFGVSIVDSSPVTTNMQMFNGINGCDLGSVVDDTPILQGTAPGQSPFPSRTSTSNSFSGIFSLNVDGSMAEDNVCIRVNVQDAAVDAAGNPANVVTRVMQTRLVPFVLPN